MSLAVLFGTAGSFSMGAAMKASFTLIALCLLAVNATAANTPCSKGKGGVAYCENGRFICNDGSVSQSKKVCQGASKSKASKKK